MSNLTVEIERLENSNRIYRENTQKALEVLFGFIEAYDSNEPARLPADRSCHTKSLRSLLHFLADRHELIEKDIK